MVEFQVYVPVDDDYLLLSPATGNPDHTTDSYKWFAFGWDDWSRFVEQASSGFWDDMQAYPQ